MFASVDQRHICLNVQVADARRQKPSLLDHVVKAFNEEPAVQITGEVRSKASIWDEGGIAPLPVL